MNKKTDKYLLSLMQNIYNLADERSKDNYIKSISDFINEIEKCPKI
jgi:hypothetical protein